MNDRIKILIGEHAGMYMPEIFTKNFDLTDWNLDPSNYGDLDPQSECYWDTWLEILNKASHTDKEGKTWTLYQDGDLFAIEQSLYEDETSEEYQEFFGEY